MTHDPHTSHEHPEHVHEPAGDSATGYAVVKYGFIFLITIAILYFIARYVLPALG
jgi:hypothetical protein